MRPLILTNFCCCATLKEGVIVATTLMAIINFLSVLVVGQLLGDSQLLPALLALFQFDSGGEPIDISNTSSDSGAALVSMYVTESTTAAPIATSESTTIVPNIINKSSMTFLNSSVNGDDEIRSQGVVPEDYSRTLEALYVMCWLQMFTVSLCLSLDLRLLQLVLRPAAVYLPSANCGCRHSWWLLLWLGVYLVELLLAAVSCILVAVAALGWITAAQMIYGAVAWYSYLTAVSYYFGWRRREDRDIALMSLAPITS